MSENFTICGHCNLRVRCIGYEPEPHNCEVISELVRKMNAALIDIQKVFERGFEQQAANFMMQKNDLLIKIADVSKQLSSCIDVGLMYSERQIRETWQLGAEKSITDLSARISDLEKMFKGHLLCDDNSQADENAKCLGLAPIAQLNTIVKDELISRMRITTLEQELDMRNVECQIALNEANELRENLRLRCKKNENLLNDIKILYQTIDDLKNENSEKTKRIEELEKMRAIREGHQPFNGGCTL